MAEATAQGIRTIASAINEKGGLDAVNLRVAEQYVTQFGKLAQESNTLILPSNVSDVASFVGTVTTAMSQLRQAIKPEIQLADKACASSFSSANRRVFLSSMSSITP